MHIPHPPTRSFSVRVKDHGRRSALKHHPSPHHTPRPKSITSLSPFSKYLHVRTWSCLLHLVVRKIQTVSCTTLRPIFITTPPITSNKPHHIIDHPKESTSSPSWPRTWIMLGPWSLYSIPPPAMASYELRSAACGTGSGISRPNRRQGLKRSSQETKTRPASWKSTIAPQTPIWDRPRSADPVLSHGRTIGS